MRFEIHRNLQKLTIFANLKYEKDVLLAVFGCTMLYEIFLRFRFYKYLHNL